MAIRKHLSSGAKVPMIPLLTTNMDNLIPEIKQTTIQIGDSKYDGYKGPDGYYMNLRQIGRLLDKAPSSPSDFFASKTFKAMYCKDLSPSDFSALDGSTAKLIETPAVAIYIQHHASKGNKLAFSLALELMQQNIDIRIENALGLIEAEKGPDGYYLNQSQVSRILNKARNSVLQVSRSKLFQSLYGKGLTALQIP